MERRGWKTTLFVASVTYSEINTLARELAFLVIWLTRPTFLS